MLRIRETNIEPPIGKEASLVLGNALIDNILLLDGDIICIDDLPSSISLFKPHYSGYPLLGFKKGNLNYSYPSRMLCSDLHWHLAGGIVAIIRNNNRYSVGLLKGAILQSYHIHIRILNNSIDSFSVLPNSIVSTDGNRRIFLNITTDPISLHNLLNKLPKKIAIGISNSKIGARAASDLANEGETLFVLNEAAKIQMPLFQRVA